MENKLRIFGFGYTAMAVGVLCGKVRIFSQGVSRALSMVVTEGELILN
jgi:hypothetical protein